MSHVYAVDIEVWATAYIRAESPDEVLAIARSLKMRSINSGGTWDDVPVSELGLNDPSLPDISVSPVMTIYGPDEDAIVELCS